MVVICYISLGSHHKSIHYTELNVPMIYTEKNISYPVLQVNHCHGRDYLRPSNTSEPLSW